MTEKLLDEARAALEAAREDPKSSLRRATEIVPKATGEETLATAHFAIGMAQRTLANGTESTAHLEQAAEHSPSFPVLNGQILRSLAFNYAQAGHHDLADRTIDRSIALLSGDERDLSRLQLAFMLIMRGDHQQALPVLTAAIEAFTARGRDANLELTLYNRALIYSEMGDYDAAVIDLEQAYETGMRQDHSVFAADAALHLSQVLGWRDDIPAAMKWHARSRELRTVSGADNPVADTEHAFLLIQARLMREAEETLADSLPRLVAAGSNEAIVVPGYLLLADVLLARGAYAAAVEHVDEAKAVSPADGRYRFDIAAMAHKIRVAEGEQTADLLDAIQATAAAMEANGELHAATVERLRAVAVALGLDDVSLATSLCKMAARVAGNGPLWLQIQWWTAVAETRLAAGNNRGAAAAVRAGFNRLDEYRGGIGATDLRIHAADYGRRLAAIGLELAIRSGSPARVFDWAERLKTTLDKPPNAATDPELRDELSRMRRISRDLRRTGTDELHRQLMDQEKKVRSLARQAVGTAGRFRPAPLATVQAHLEDRFMIEYVRVAGRAYAVTATSQATSLVELGSSLSIDDLVDQLRFAAERIARPSTSDASRLAALASVTEVSSQLKTALLDPIGSRPAGGRMLLLPAAGLHGIPWGHVIDTPVEVAPSATTWLACRNSVAPTEPPVVIAGPGLEHARAETAAIAAVVGAETVSTGAVALRRVPNSRLSHFACHARPRLDSPMFSSLVLNDGEITLYDLEQLAGAPATVVLAACDGGSAVIASGDEVLGLAGAFLSLGSRTVVAPLFTVSDPATATAMIGFHQQLATGRDPATALAEIRNSDDPVVGFTARSFTCFGAA